jgi:hypothetical protein
VCVDGCHDQFSFWVPAAAGLLKSLPVMAGRGHKQSR